jgi:transposase
MDYIQGKPRSQIVLIESSLEELIEQVNPVRFIDAFVDSCKLDEFGFTHAKHAPEGRPPYHPGDLLKLYIYGYLNRIRTTRLLEKECKRNLEVKWLLKELIPDHNTIGNFRKDNPKAIKLVFRKMVTLCKRLDLIGGKVIATDGTKLRAQNSKKNNFNQKKIDDHLAYIDNKLHEYLDALDMADAAETMGLDTDIDKGYHTGSEISRCYEMGIETMVAVPSLSTQAPDPAFNLEKFIYHQESDTYNCPQGNSLFTNGNWYNKGYNYKIKQYKTKACKNCPSRALCTKAKNGRIIERSEHAEAVNRNKLAIEQNKELYKRRQEIVEHPFGTIKRQWGFDYTLLKGKKKVDGDVGLIFIAYLFTRMRSILGVKGLMEAIASILSSCFDLYLTIKHQIIEFQRRSKYFSLKSL